MAPARQDEIERTFDVDETTVLPTLAGLDDVSTMGQPAEMHLEAVYFDTADLVLARHGVTLRRRIGGDDDGWHMKLPRDEDTRTELRCPLDGTTPTVPGELLWPVRALVRDHPLEPIARVSTRRLRYALLGEDAAALAQLCDDHVNAERLHGVTRVQDWREWEVELAGGAPSLLDVVEQCLLGAGATRSPSGSKLMRTLGEAAPAPLDNPSRKQLSSGSAVQAVLDYVSDQVAELQVQDFALRADHPGSVHKLRIAARRLRSALKTYAPLLEAASASRLGEELRWLGQTLGQARDAEVLREHLHALVASEPAELVLGPVTARLDHELRTSGRHGRETALQVLSSERYFRLLDALDRLARPSAFLPAADAPAREVFPRLLQRDAKRVRRAVEAVRHTQRQGERDVALHEVRKKIKRLRYAAESTVPVLGERAEDLGRRLKDVQQALGEHQDSVMARDVLREYGVRAHLDGENGFTFGRLHALEQARAEAAAQEFLAAWEVVPSMNLRRWLLP